jgi:hypothetical protein
MLVSKLKAAVAVVIVLALIATGATGLASRKAAAHGDNPPVVKESVKVPQADKKNSTLPDKEVSDLEGEWAVAAMEGDGEEVFEPRFTTHGFRYAEISGLPDRLDPSQLTARVVSSMGPATGSFACSDELVNGIHRNVLWSLRGGLVGIPHPFDRHRRSLLNDASMAQLVPLVDWVETHNARLIGHGNDDAQAFALEHGLPGISVSDAHSVMEVGVAYTAFDGDPSTAAGLLATLPTAEIIPGRASYLVRLWTPFAKSVNHVRGNRRVAIAPAEPVEGSGDGSDPRP